MSVKVVVAALAFLCVATASQDFMSVEFSPEGHVPMHPGAPKGSYDDVITPRNITCGDGVTECPNGFMCCEEKYGNYSCCPYQSGTCCEENLCCTAGFYCCMSKYGCCALHLECCGTHCCMTPLNWTCCGDYRCCSGNLNEVCCLDFCCTPHYPVCCPDAFIPGCCPAEYPICCANNLCCHAGTHCCIGGCCPDDDPTDMFAMPAVMKEVHTRKPS